MFKGNWLRNAAIGLAAFALLVWAMAAWMIPEPPRISQREPFTEAYSEYEAQREQCSADSLQRVRSSRDREKQAAECSEQAEQHRLQVDDLNQQTRAANAAEETARLTYGQIRASVVEACIILLALMAATWAAWEARNAALAAHAGNAQDERQSRQQLRAYLVFAGFEEEKFPSGERLLRVCFPRWRNSGETPTRQMRCVTNQKVFLKDQGGPSDTDFADLEGAGVSHFLIGPGLEVTGPAVLINEGELLRIKGTGDALYAWGWADYNDVFEKTPRWRTEFCYRAIPLFRDDGSLGVRWQPEGIYNSADGDCLRKPTPPYYPPGMERHDATPGRE